MSAGACGGCEAPAPATPVRVHNRPGLSAIAYRVGSFASFREAMVREIASSPALRELGTRASDDYAITVLELWAAVLDVLGFYQERIANETFLRTATRRDSVLRLARMLGYELGPGSAATAQLAFTAEPGRSVAIPVGLRVQSVPGQDQKPQKFETLEAITAHPWLGAATVYPRPNGVNPLSRGRACAWLAPGAEGLEAAKALAAGETVMLHDGVAPPERLVVAGVDVDGEHLRLRWRAPVAGAGWSLTTRVRRWRRTLKLFGHNAPAQYTAPVEDGPILRWELRTIGTGAPGADSFALAAGDVLHLDASYGDLEAGARLLLVESAGQQRELTVVEVEQSDQTLGPVTDTVTRVRVTPPFAAIDDRRDVVLHELAGAGIRFWGYDYPARLREPMLFLPGRRIDAQTVAVARGIERFELGDGERVELASLAPGRRLILHDPAGDPLDATLHRAATVGLEPLADAVAGDPHTVGDLGLAPGLAATRCGACSAALDPFPALTAGQPMLRVRVDERAPIALAFPAPPASVEEAAAALGPLLRAAADDERLAGCEVFAIDDRLVVMPGGDEAVALAFEAHEDDETSVVELGLDDTALRPVACLRSAVLPDPPALTVLPATLQLAIGPVGPRTLALDAVPASLVALADALETELNAADPAPAFHHARVEVRAGRLWIFAGPLGQTPREYLRLDVRCDTALDLDRAATRVHGNVAQASHGETVQEETLGDGDPSVAFQRLALAKSPLTHVPVAGATAPQSTLRLEINGMPWSRVPSLHGAGANATVYAERLDDDARTHVTFGDGATGARPPAGRGNVVARYRQGLGLAGRVDAATLTNALDRPKGLKAVVNPAPADGGADPETLDEARDNAPSTVKTFDRAVSLRDFEDLVKAGGEVAKARAAWVWSRGARAVHLTIAGQGGGAFSPSALARIHASLAAGRDPNRALLIDNYVARPIAVTATLAVADAYRARDVRSNARAALEAALAFEALGFAESVHLSDVHAVLQAVAGVVGVDVDVLAFKQAVDVSDAAYQAFLDARGARRRADGSADPLQPRLRILPARPGGGPDTPPALPAEQARLETPDQDLILHTTGGVPD